MGSGFAPQLDSIDAVPYSNTTGLHWARRHQRFGNEQQAHARSHLPVKEAPQALLQCRLVAACSRLLEGQMLVKLASYFWSIPGFLQLGILVVLLVSSLMIPGPRARATCS